MSETLRNMLRRKVRTSLTLLGIIIGVLALTVMGALAERMNLLVASGLDYWSTRVVVHAAGSAGTMMATGRPMDAAVAEEIQRVPGVKAAFPELEMLLEKEVEAASFGMPFFIMGVRPEVREYETYPLSFAQGGHLQPGEQGKVLIGADVAKKYSVGLGDRLPVRGKEMEVKGVLRRTMTVTDKIVIMNLKDAQELYVADLPPVLKPESSNLATSLSVFPNRIEEADALAARINQQIPTVKATPPSELRRQLQIGLVVFNSILMGSAIIALVVGGLAVINTMVMSVNERTREIGIKKAIGATTGNILREYLLEAALIGFTGGLVGLGLGSLVVHLLNGVTAASGEAIFALTWRLGIGAVAFAAGLGALAGLYPAFRASRLNPVEALRSE